jgi:hypothetical protein
MKLIKQETGKKSSKFIYSIVDENGNVLTTRSSNREYVAATICGTFFFGRLDLIGKGEHGSRTKDLQKHIERLSKMPQDKKEVEWAKYTIGEDLEHSKIWLKKFQTIAK